MDKKKEKLVKTDGWAYYLPAGWICYNIDWRAKKIQQINQYIGTLEAANRANSPKSAFANSEQRGFSFDEPESRYDEPSEMHDSFSSSYALSKAPQSPA